MSPILESGRASILTHVTSTPELMYNGSTCLCLVESHVWGEGNIKIILILKKSGTLELLSVLCLFRGESGAVFH